MLPFGSMRPIWLAAASVNHILPSGPRVMPSGSLLLVGMRNDLNRLLAATCVRSNIDSRKLNTVFLLSHCIFHLISKTSVSVRATKRTVSWLGVFCDEKAEPFDRIGVVRVIPLVESSFFITARSQKDNHLLGFLRLEQIGDAVTRYVRWITGLKRRRDQDAVADYRHLLGEAILHRRIGVKERFDQVSGRAIKEIGSAKKGIAFDIPKGSNQDIIARDCQRVAEELKIFRGRIEVAADKRAGSAVE